ncbi:hypothetical protein V8F20_000282 [Naviculisporaceae sp. PSN 640]
MPPRARAQAEAPADQEGTQITQRDLLVFKDLVNNITVKPTVDWEGFARDCGFKNVETAKVCVKSPPSSTIIYSRHAFYFPHPCLVLFSPRHFIIPTHVSYHSHLCLPWTVFTPSNH